MVRKIVLKRRRQCRSGAASLSCIHGVAQCVDSLYPGAIGKVLHQIEREYPSLVQAISGAQTNIRGEPGRGMPGESLLGSVNAQVIHPHVCNTFEGGAVQAQSQRMIARGVKERLEKEPLLKRIGASAETVEWGLQTVVIADGEGHSH